MANEILRQYDAFHGLVVVHPDFTSRSQHPFYAENLRDALALFKAQGKPIFVARDRIRRADSEVWNELRSAGAWTLPINEPDNGMFVSLEAYLLQSQKEVDFMVARIAMPRADIKLAFAGLNAEECVYGFATAYCREVDTNYRGNEPEPTVKNPIGFGKVFDEIV